MELLRKLCWAIGPSGYEVSVSQVWKEYVEKRADKVYRDALGNTIAVLNPDKEIKVMFSAHIDEIGFMIRYIDKDGFLFFSPIGGVDPTIVVGQRVRIMTKDGIVYGVIGKKPIHLMEREEFSKKIKWEDLFVDIGVSCEDEAKSLVEVGDVFVVDVELRELAGNRVASKSMDDRIGVYILAKVLESVAGKNIGIGVYFVASVQEEIGLRGAKTGAYGISPDIGIAIDVTFATDSPGIEKKKIGDVRLGAGAVIARGPNIDHGVFEFLVSVAKNNAIPYQIEGIPRATGTDANVIQVSRVGVRTGLVSIPLRYMHTPVEVLDIKDVDAVVRLLSFFIEELSKNKGKIG